MRCGFWSGDCAGLIVAEFDTDYTKVPICPHCGEKQEDDLEFMSEGENDCDNCGKPYELTIYESVNYSTEKIEDL